MIPKPLKDIRLTELESLIGIARESKTLEFKAELPRKADSELVPFIAGGGFVLGVYAREGVAAGVPGIVIPNLDAEKLRLEQALANGLEPRLPRVDIEAVDCGGGQYVLVVRVLRSWVGPHRVKANNCFYGRNSGGRYPLDVGELRTAFVMSESVADRIRSFRAERLAQIGGGGTPVPLPPGGRATLQVVPFPPFAGRHDIDVVQAISEGTFMPLPLGGMSGANQLSVNLNGIVNFAPGSSVVATSYVQFFRNGALVGSSLLVRTRGITGHTLPVRPSAERSCSRSGNMLTFSTPTTRAFGFPILVFYRHGWNYTSLQFRFGCRIQYPGAKVRSDDHPARDYNRRTGGGTTFGPQTCL